MTIFDRYLLKLFFKIFVICFVSMAGLYTVIHVFTNLDELNAAADLSGGMGALLFNFYGPRTLELFDKMSGILLLISGIFAVTWMQRRRELDAIQAIGVTKSRVVRPIILASIGVIALTVANREVLIPRIKHQLVRELKNWGDSGTVPMTSQKDQKSGVIVRGDEFVIETNSIINPEVQMPMLLSRHYSRIKAEFGVVVDEKPHRPAGLVLLKVAPPQDPSEMPSIVSEGETVVFTPKEFKWLKADQIFVACELDVSEIAFGNQVANYWSLPEMIASIKRPSRRMGFGDHVALHGRVLRPILDFALLLIGLPLVIGKSKQNIFMAAALCMLVVIGVQMTTLVAHGLGTYNVVSPPALAAWIPVLIFLPLASITLGRLK